MLIDTHCHIHDEDYPINADQAIESAVNCGVQKMICIGTSVSNSKLALDFAANRQPIYVAIGVHPHESKGGIEGLEELIIANKNLGKLVAIGEIGLDYHYDFSPRSVQADILRQQIKLAVKYDLPIIFHVRESYDDFWLIYDEFINDGYKIKGVIHSFTDNEKNLNEALKRGLFIGVNGFSTFVKDEAQKRLFIDLPIEKLMLETDAPYLTPAPFRGRVNEPAFVNTIAEYLSLARNISVDKIETTTTANASKLFNLFI